jgi:cellulose synthase/poly-beta-1,6-N-acetylglucosamine synthase-like glycosyltransferase
MMAAIAWAASIGYVALSALLLAHAIVQATLALSFRRAAPPVAPPCSAWPRVTIQLPVLDERYVIERLLDAVAAIRYPRERLQVQVLDDSSDDTTTIVAARLPSLRAAGLVIEHIRRPIRVGYKAGSLRDALVSATGELVAIFDADFVPPADFLERLIPHFADPRVAVVQARWGHLNRDASVLTSMQAFLLDRHFALEQGGRSRQSCFINFNGSAGVWRVAAIHDAGGWSADTLTEDLDLSYRTQLRGWRFVYLDDVVCPADLPADLRAFRIQQHRWMKGVAENARRLLGPVLRAEVPWRVKLHACAHLVESAMYLVVLGLVVATAGLVVLAARGQVDPLVLFNPALVAAIVVLGFAYFLGRRPKEDRGVLRFLIQWATFFVLTTGMALHNGLAVIEGLLGRRTPFRRTPKWTAGAPASYRPRGLDKRFVWDVAAWAYFVATIVAAARAGVLPLAWLCIVAAAGYTFFLVTGLRDVAGDLTATKR